MIQRSSALSALTVAGLIAFIVIERSVRAPLLPLKLYAERGFATAALQGTLLNFAFYGVLFSMSLLLQQGRHLSALVTGLLFLPLTGLISIANLGSAPLTRRLGRPAVLAIGQAVLTLALLALAWASTSASVWPMVLALIPIGFSSGLLVPTMTAQSIAAVEPDLHGAASAAFNTSRQIGAAIGVATFGPLLGRRPQPRRRLRHLRNRRRRREHRGPRRHRLRPPYPDPRPLGGPRFVIRLRGPG